MVVVVFLVNNKVIYIRFLKEIFLMTNVNPKVVFEITFIKKRLLVPDLVTCYSMDAQREWIKLRRSCE